MQSGCIVTIVQKIVLVAIVAKKTVSFAIVAQKTVSFAIPYRKIVTGKFKEAFAQMRKDAPSSKDDIKISLQRKIFKTISRKQSGLEFVFDGFSRNH